LHPIAASQGPDCRVYRIGEDQSADDANIEHRRLSISPNGHYGIFRNHSGLMLAVRITFPPQPWTKYLYAWGRVTYVDGFGNERWTNFCHRYNTEVKEAQIGGGNRIRKEYGRHHEYGNDAN
jgi:hypothetical protein